MTKEKLVGKPHDNNLESMLNIFVECPLSKCSDRLNNYECFTKDYENCIFYKAYILEVDKKLKEN